MNIFRSRLTYKYSSKGIKTTPKKAKITKNGNFLKHPFKRAVPVLNRATSAHCHKSKFTLLCFLQVKKNITNLKFLRPKPRKSVLSRALKLALWDVTKCFLQEQNLIILHEIT